MVKLFPDPPKMTAREMNELAHAINHPAIQKYLTYLAQHAIKDLVHSIRGQGESAESFLERVALLKGGLSVVESLLTIDTVPQQN